MQMVMIIIGGYVVASTPLVYRAIRGLAGIPKTPRAAVAMVALFSMLTSLISWGLSLIFSGLLVREMAIGSKAWTIAPPALPAYLGLGAVWAHGFVVFRRHADGDQIRHATSALHHQRTDPSHANSVPVAEHGDSGILIVLSVLIAYLSTPSAENARTAESYGIQYEPIRSSLRAQDEARRMAGIQSAADHPGCRAAVWYLVDVFRTSPQGALAALDLNTYNLMFITVGLLLHWRPKRFMRAVADCVPATGGVLIQFPFYAVIFGMIVGTGISDVLAKLVRCSQHAQHLSTC